MGARSGGGGSGSGFGSRSVKGYTITFFDKKNGTWPTRTTKATTMAGAMKVAKKYEKKSGGRLEWSQFEANK